MIINYLTTGSPEPIRAERKETMKNTVFGIIARLAPDAMVVLKTTKYGMFFAGKAKYALSRMTFETSSCVPHSIETDSAGATVITVE